MKVSKAASIATSIVRSLIFPLVYVAGQVMVTMFIVVFEMLNSGGMADYEQIMTDTLSKTVDIILVTCIITVLVIMVTLRVQKKSMVEELGLRLPKSPFPVILLCLLLGLAMTVTAGMIMSVLPIPESMMNEYDSIITSMLTSSSPLVMAVTLALIVPICEELVFRGMAQNALKRSMPVVAVVVIQAVIFAVTHGNLIQMAYVFPVALVFGVIYVWSESIIATIAMHIGFNSLSALSGAFMTEAAGEPAEMPAPAEFIPYIIGGLIVCAVFIAMIRHLTRKTPAVTPIR